MDLIHYFKMFKVCYRQQCALSRRKHDPCWRRRNQPVEHQWALDNGLVVESTMNEQECYELTKSGKNISKQLQGDFT